MQFDHSIFKAYDIRGTYPDQLNEEIARLIGAGFVHFTKSDEVYVGRDMRKSSPAMFDSLVDGITSSGADVVDLGMVSTDGLYFAVGKFGGQGGIMITASHNPPEYNGFKMCMAEAVPLSEKRGLPEIKKFVAEGEILSSKPRGKVISRDITEDYTKHCLSFIYGDKIKPFKIAIDAGNGMAGKTLPSVMKKLPLELEPLYFELDGSFPNHLASPIEPKNTEKLREMISENPQLNIGAAFDGDADRMFLIDEKGQLLGGDMVTALVSKSILKKNPGETIVYNLICSNAVPEVIEKMGGKALRTRVGHAIIKPIMKEENAIFGGEHSGHFYFRDNWFADSGLIAFLVCLELLSESKKPLSELVSEIDPYFRSGEINSRVKDRKATLDKVRDYFSKKNKRIDDLDGITIFGDNWWANLRPSNTEPLIRLNAEANDRKTLHEMVNEILSIVRS